MDADDRSRGTTKAPPSETAEPSLSLLSDPSLLAKIGTLLGQGSTASPAPAKENPPNAGEGLAAVLSNPALMEKLPQVMSMLAPMLSSATEKPSRSGVGELGEKEALLCALKPFLSSERQAAIDTILQIQQLGLALGRMQKGR